MLTSTFYSDLEKDSLAGKEIADDRCLSILNSEEIDILPLLAAAYTIRKKYWGKEVIVHIINNIQNGLCSEDCKYCAQSTSSTASIDTYQMKSDEKILEEAKVAYESGAYRYCMVFSGTGPTSERVKHLESLIQTIKSKFPLEVCVSPGVMSEENLKVLKESGLNRLNHNLNTSDDHYGNICTSHSFEQRLHTLQSAANVGLDICSGLIIGMGETSENIVKAAKLLRSLKQVKSIPINFLLPIPGIALKSQNKLTPEFCLRVLTLFRFLNPETEIRTAAGRELHLKSLEPMCLYPANSIFMNGYLNTEGGGCLKDLNMIKDLGFTIKGDKTVTELLKRFNLSDTV